MPQQTNNLLSTGGHGQLAEGLDQPSLSPLHGQLLRPA
jgi:hypothetical protein